MASGDSRWPGWNLCRYGQCGRQDPSIMSSTIAVSSCQMDGDRVSFEMLVSLRHVWFSHCHSVSDVVVVAWQMTHARGRHTLWSQELATFCRLSVSGSSRITAKTLCHSFTRRPFCPARVCHLILCNVRSIYWLLKELLKSIEQPT